VQKQAMRTESNFFVAKRSSKSSYSVAEVDVSQWR
jgi:hypothetical protein